MAKVVWGVVALSFGANLLELALFRLLMIIFGPGLNNLWLGGIMFLCLVWLLFAGQSGGREMLLSLKKSLSNILVRSFVLLVPLWDFGQHCIQNP